MDQEDFEEKKVVVPESQKSEPKQKRRFNDKKGKKPERLFESFPKGFRLHQTSSNARKKSIQKEIKKTEEEKDFAKRVLYQKQESGFVEADENELTYDVTQGDIKNSVDLQSSHKIFKLKLDFGPYKVDYTRDGNNLLLAGTKGHIAVLNWKKMKIAYESQVRETVRDACFLHNQNRIAVAQKKYTYIYNEFGAEVHRLNEPTDVVQTTYMPYHWLLVTLYLDVSTGEVIARYQTMPTKRVKKSKALQEDQVNVKKKQKKPFHNVNFTINPQNGVLFLGSSAGTVSLWTPNVPKPLAKIFTHEREVRSIQFSSNGREMITSDVSGQVKIWDIRKFEPLKQALLPQQSSGFFTVSQRNMVAAVTGQQTIYTWKDYMDLPESCDDIEKGVYLAHTLPQHCHSIQGMKFCPFEDFLGLGYTGGFSSIAIPGSGEPNPDYLESNPFSSKKISQDYQVRSLLEKIQPQMITLEPEAEIGAVLDPEKVKLQSDIHHSERQAQDMKDRIQKINKTAKKKKMKERLKEALKVEARIKKKKVEAEGERLREKADTFLSSDDDDEEQSESAQSEEEFTSIDDVLQRFI